MNVNRATTALLVVFCSTSASAAQYDFRPKDGSLGRFMLFDGEVLVHSSGKTSPERPEFLVWTTNACKGPARLFFDSEREKTKFFLVDDTNETPQLLIKEIDTTNLKLLDKKVAPETIHWNWEPIDNRGDDKGSYSRLRVEQGKFKGYYLAVEPKAIDVTSDDGKRRFQAHKVKFVKQPEDALTFVVYVVSK